MKTKSVTLQQSWYDTNRRGALLRQQAVAIVLIGAVAFNFGLCFINTNIHQVNAAAPMAAEGAIILSALILLMLALQRSLLAQQVYWPASSCTSYYCMLVD